MPTDSSSPGVLTAQVVINASSVFIQSLKQPLQGYVALSFQSKAEQPAELFTPLQLELIIRGNVVRSGKSGPNLCFKSIALHAGSHNVKREETRFPFKTTLSAVLEGQQHVYVQRQEGIEAEQLTPIPPEYSYTFEHDDLPNYTMDVIYVLEASIRTPGIHVQHNTSTARFYYNIPFVNARDIPESKNEALKTFKIKTTGTLPKKSSILGGLVSHRPTWVFDLKTTNLPRYLQSSEAVQFEVICDTDWTKSKLARIPRLVVQECRIGIYESWLRGQDKVGRLGLLGAELVKTIEFPEMKSRVFSSSPGQTAGTLSLTLRQSTGFEKVTPSFNSPIFAVVHWIRLKMLLCADGTCFDFNTRLIPAIVLPKVVEDADTTKTT